tara:strand:- start:358 stop:918 length:561 start_codon:yes stop_codon:yes gene_type:complete
MKVLIIDNYDSFTFNLVHLLECFTDDYEVWRNDEIDFERVSEFNKIILSPGPGLPSEAGQMLELIERFALLKPMLGVCLGCQALGLYFGAELYNLEQVQHGVQTAIRTVDSNILYKNIEDPLEVGRYHSWALKLSNASDLVPTAYDKKNVLMSFRHSTLSVFGIQYHPESIMTPQGKEIIRNWINY